MQRYDTYEPPSIERQPWPDAWPALEPFGPIYPDLGKTIAKSRAAAQRDPTKRRDHGYAVLEAIRKLQRQELQRATSEPGRRPNCASGTWASGGDAVLKAIREQHRRALDGALHAANRARSDDKVRELYLEAMAAKQAATAHAMAA